MLKMCSWYVKSKFTFFGAVTKCFEYFQIQTVRTYKSVLFIENLTETDQFVSKHHFPLDNRQIFHVEVGMTCNRINDKKLSR